MIDSEEGEPTDGQTQGTHRLILNPISGGGGHAEQAHRLAQSYEFSVTETDYTGHGVELAKRAAADGVDLLAVCGGDGTIHEIIQGLIAAEALKSVTLCVVPAGTVNILADRLGIRSMRHGFKLAESGDTRRLDLGMANDEPFVISAVVGVPAETSASVSPGLKSRLGRLGFVIEGIQKARRSGGLRVEVDAISEGEEIIWKGNALSVIAGNLRRFIETNERANAEDGTLEITIVEPLSGIDAIVETVARRLLHRETSHVTDLESDRLEIIGLERVHFEWRNETNSTLTSHSNSYFSLYEDGTSNELDDLVGYGENAYKGGNSVQPGTSDAGYLQASRIRSTYSEVSQVAACFC